MIKKTLVFTVFIFLFLNLSAQTKKRINSIPQTWTQYFLEGKLNDRSSLHFDGGVRFNNFFGERFLILLRPGYIHKFNKKLSAAGGYAYFRNFGAKNTTEKDVSENRLWQEGTYKLSLSRLAVQQRLRFEERWIDFENTNFNLRVRYALTLKYPIVHNNSFSASLLFYDELIFAFGRKNYRTFLEQNRTYGGLEFSLKDIGMFTMGYQQFWQPQAETSVYDRLHIFRVTLKHSFNLRKAG